MTTTIHREKGTTVGGTNNMVTDNKIRDEMPKNSKNGLTFEGKVFKIPEIEKDRAFKLAKPNKRQPITSYIAIIMGLAYMTLAFSGKISDSDQIMYSILWRLIYNVGIGYLLYKQSSCGWLVKKLSKQGFGKIDEGKKRPLIPRLLINQIRNDYFAGQSSYDYEALPLEYNSWLLFRYIVDFVFTNELFSYIVTFLNNFNVPSGFNLMVILRYLLSFSLILLGVWVKTSAYDVLGDYGWYWGDYFYTMPNYKLVFNGVFKLFPHPMYTVGYSTLYGFSLFCGSFKMLFLSIFVHISQLCFLKIAETPHLSKIYPNKSQVEFVEKKSC